MNSFCGFHFILCHRKGSKLYSSIYKSEGVVSFQILLIRDSCLIKFVPYTLFFIFPRYCVVIQHNLINEEQWTQCIQVHCNILINYVFTHRCNANSRRRTFTLNWFAGILFGYRRRNSRLFPNPHVTWNQLIGASNGINFRKGRVKVKLFQVLSDVMSFAWLPLMATDEDPWWGELRNTI